MTYANGEITYGADQTLYGKDAVSYIRSRGKDYEAARYRLEKQKQFLKAFVTKLKDR